MKDTLVTTRFNITALRRICLLSKSTYTIKQPNMCKFGALLYRWTTILSGLTISTWSCLEWDMKDIHQVQWRESALFKTIIILVYSQKNKQLTQWVRRSGGAPLFLRGHVNTWTFCILQPQMGILFLQNSVLGGTRVKDLQDQCLNVPFFSPYM